MNNLLNKKKLKIIIENCLETYLVIFSKYFESEIVRSIIVAVFDKNVLVSSIAYHYCYSTRILFVIYYLKKIKTNK